MQDRESSMGMRTVSTRGVFAAYFLRRAM